MHAVKILRLRVGMIVRIYHNMCDFMGRLYMFFTACNVRWRRQSIIYMMNVPVHGNMGDQGIVIAEKAFFSHYFKNYKYFQITSGQWELNKNIIKKFIRKKDIICIHGGGYIGDLWPGAEKIAKDIILNFPHNKIIMMPNTIFYDEKSRESLGLSFFDKNNIYLFLRDLISYKKAQACGIKNIYLVPDTVTFLDRRSNQKRSGVLFCVRNDREKVLSNDIFDNIYDLFKAKGFLCHRSDMKTKHGVTFWNRRLKVKKKLKEFQKAEMVVTDRLHGMYFSAITGTPCLAFDNISGKVAGGYNWIRKLGYIYFQKGLDMVSICNLLKRVGENECKNRPCEILKQEHDSMYKHINSIIQCQI